VWQAADSHEDALNWPRYISARPTGNDPLLMQSRQGLGLICAQPALPHPELRVLWMCPRLRYRLRVSPGVTYRSEDGDPGSKSEHGAIDLARCIVRVTKNSLHALFGTHSHYHAVHSDPVAFPGMAVT
jgi:hypothetical protein